jgi:hypothetical protein
LEAPLRSPSFHFPGRPNWRLSSPCCSHNAGLVFGILSVTYPLDDERFWISPNDIWASMNSQWRVLINPILFWVRT